MSVQGGGLTGSRLVSQQATNASPNAHTGLHWRLLQALLQAFTLRRGAMRRRPAASCRHASKTTARLCAPFLQLPLQRAQLLPDGFLPLCAASLRLR